MFQPEPVRVDDRFGEDTRDDYRLQGDVDWSLMKLSLPEQSSFGYVRTLDADFEVELELWPGEVGAKPSVTRLNLVMANRWQLAITIVRARQAGQLYRQVIISESDGRIASQKPTVRKLRQSQAFVVSGEVEKWSIDYDYGVVRLACNGREVAAVYFEAFSSWFNGFVLSQASGKLDVSRFALAGETVGYSEAQREAYNRINLWRGKGNAAWAEGDLAKAIRLEERAIGLASEAFGPEDFSIGLMRSQLASYHALTGDGDACIEQYELASEIFGSSFGTDHPEVHLVESMLAEQRAKSGELEDAERVMRRAASSYAKLTNPMSPNVAALLGRYIGVLEAVAVRAAADGAHATALRHKQEIAAISRKIYGPDAWQTRDADTEVELFERLTRADGEELQALSRYVEETARMILLIGEWRLDESTELEKRVLELARRAFDGPHTRLAQHLGSVAVKVFNEGDVDRSLRMMNEAIAIYEALGERHSPHCAWVRGLLGAQYSMLGRFQEAQPLLEQACKDFDAMQDGRTSNAARMKTELGRHLVRVGKPREAFPHLKAAVQIYQSVGDVASPDALKAYERLADVLRVTGQTGAAEELVAYQRNVVEAVHGAESSLALDILTAEARHLYMRRKYDEAAERYESAAEVAERHYGKTSRAYAAVLQGQIDVHLARGDVDAVVDCFEQRLACELHQRERLFNVYDERQQLDQSLQDMRSLDGLILLALEGHLPAGRAYDHALSYKGAVTARQRSERIASRTPEARALLEELRQIDARLELNANDRVEGPRAPSAEALALRRQRVESSLAEINRDYAVARRHTRAADISGVLPDGAVLIDYYEYFRPTSFAARLFGSRPQLGLVAFVLPPSGEVRLVDLGRIKPVEEALTSWRMAMNAEPIYAIADPERDVAALTDGWGSRVRELIWDPVAAHLGGAETLLVSPSVRLSSCPLAALPSPDRREFLIERKNLVHVTTPRLLPEMLAERPDTPPEPSLLLVSDINYNAGISLGRRRTDPLFSRLENAEEALAPIRAAYQRLPTAGSPRQLTGAHATETRFREAAPEVRYIHLHTHGFCLPVESESLPVKYVSGVALAGGNRGIATSAATSTDGVLLTTEIASLDLHEAELVTLAACQTALGEPVPGEGMLGAQRALHVAGARSSLTTLWSVNDQCTRVLMAQFYDRLWRDRLSKGEALRSAMRHLLRDYNWLESFEESGGLAPTGRRTPPALWAGFVLHGDWQ